MSEIDMESAVAALSEDLPDVDGGEVSTDETIVVEDNQVEEPESFTGFDPTVLPEDMQAVYKSMQADYTRKTQEVAEIRRSYEAFTEAGVDPNTALQAVGFLNELNSNPEYALQLAQEIQENYGAPQTEQTVVEDTSNSNYEGIPPELVAELSEMRAFRDEMTQNQQQQQVLEELEGVEKGIRATNPHYTDEDIDSIYSLAYAYQGDLVAASQAYHAMQQRLLGNYLTTKAVPHGATPTPGGPASVPNREFASLDEAHKAAMESLRNSM